MDYETNRIITQEELNKMGEELSNYAESLINQQFKKISNDMNYEQKYKEANDKVVARFGTNVAKEIFTDLYESEDERIRKVLVNLVKNNGTSYYIDKIHKDDILAWLEKQGEQKVSVVEFNAKDWYVSKVDGKIYNAKFMKKNSTNLARKLEIEKAAMSATGIIDREEWFIKGAEWADENPAYISSEKQGEQKASYTTIVETGDGGINALVTKELPTNGCDDEQKPAEWNEDNNSIISDLLDYFDEDKCLKHEVNDIVKWLKTIKPQQKGWGDNEIKMFDNLITYLDGRKDLLEEIKRTYIDWLKSIKSRVKPKQEWSEEDQNALEDVREAVVHYWGGDTQDILLYWLKSLKDKIKEE